MLLSEILDPVYVRVRDNLPVGLTADRMFTATTNPTEQSVTKSKVVLYLEPAASRITTLGSEEVCRRFERAGTIRVVVHTPAQVNGDIAGIMIAEQIAALFEGYAGHSPVHYDNVAVRSTGRDGNAAWLTSVVMSYRLDVVK